MNNIKDNYLRVLAILFCKTKGISLNDINYQDFIKWISMNGLVMKEYIDYLDYLSFPVDFGLEIDKGRYDSMSLYRDVDISSLYGESLDKDSSIFFVHKGYPYVKTSDEILEVYNRKIIIHNPYDLDSIMSLKDLHNNGLDISVGMYGQLNDKDKKEKIDALERLKKQLTRDYSLQSDTDNDKYFISLNSISYVKKRHLVR